MPVTLNTFKNAVQNADADSFIRMSGSRPGEIVNYGTCWLFRKLGWYTHGTATQNRQVREQLFAVLQGEGQNVQAQTLERIRQQLHIDASGNSDVTTQLTAREIKRILDDVVTDNANVQARKAFAVELQNQFPKGLGGKIIELLGLNNPEKMLQPLTEEDKVAIRGELQKKGKKEFMDIFADLHIPDFGTLERLPLDARDLKRYKEWLTEGAMKGQFSESTLNILVTNVNSAMAKAQESQAEEKLLAAFAQLQAETGVDVTALKDDLLKQVLRSASSAASMEANVVSTPMRISELIDASIANVVSKRKALITGIQNANPKLDPIMKDGLLKLAATDPSLKKAPVALCIPEFASPLCELMEYVESPNPSKEGFVQKLHAWDMSFTDAVRTLRERVHEEVGPDDMYSLNQWMTKLALFWFEKKYGKAPEMDATLVPFIKQLRADSIYMSSGHFDAGADLSKPYAYSEVYAQMDGAGHFITLTTNIGEIFHIKLNDENLPQSNGLSQDSAEFMAMTGNGMAKRYPDPYGKVIDQQLGSLFQEVLKDNLELQRRRSVNEALTDYSKMFASVLTDQKRCGLGLKLGDTVISYARVADLEENALEKIQAFFEQDATLGINAARVLSGIVNQTMLNNSLLTLKKTGEGCGMVVGPNYAMTLNVTRRAEGNYVIEVKYDLVPKRQGKNEENLVNLNQSQSHFSLAFKVFLSVDGENKQASLEVSSLGTKLHAEVHKSKFTEAELGKISWLTEPGTESYLENQILSCPGLDEDAHLKELLASDVLNQQAIFDYLKDKILTDSDTELLVALGMTIPQIRDLSTELLPGARLTKELVLRLRGDDATDRQAAFDELKGLCQRLVDAGWQKSVGLVSVYDQALTTVGGLKTNSKNLGIVRAFIHASEDEDIRNIPYVLATGDETSVNMAKERLMAAITQARRALGVDLLKTLSGKFSSEEIQMLRAAPDQGRVRRYMEAIVLENGDMDTMIEALKAYVKVLKFMPQQAEPIA